MSQPGWKTAGAVGDGGSRGGKRKEKEEKKKRKKHTAKGKKVKAAVLWRAQHSFGVNMFFSFEEPEEGSASLFSPSS